MNNLIEDIIEYHRAYGMLIVLALIVFSSCTSLPTNGRVVFINVEHGDATLIQIPSERGMKNILIDSGYPTAYSLLEKALLYYGVTRIDLAIATHSDEDHIGNFARLSKKIPITRLIDNGVQYPRPSPIFEEYSSLMKTLPVTILRNDTVLFFGQTRLEILAPFARYGFSEDNDENSLVLKLVTSNASFLFLGDCTGRCESELLSRGITADVVRTAHHGSTEGNSLALLKMIHPREAIISSGEPFFAEHPSAQTLHVLHELNIPYRVTHTTGTMEIDFK